jgi:formamidopyrimidine-DNA glycosylase
VPELPEVEFCRRALERWALGRRITRIDLVDPRSVRARREDRPSSGGATLGHLEGAECGRVERHGKRMLWHVGGAALLLHLGMTGKWTLREGPFEKVRIHLQDGAVLRFSDPRLLGGVVPCTLATGREMLSAGLGPDALGPLPPLRGKRAVKVAIMDQSAVAGLGNLHAAEALWRARIDPRLPSDALGDRHAALEQAIHAQLAWAMSLDEGAEEITYTEEAGAPNPFPIYGQRGRPCPRCATPVDSFRQAGRTTWWCPGCQGGWRL